MSLVIFTNDRILLLCAHSVLQKSYVLMIALISTQDKQLILLFKLYYLVLVDKSLAMQYSKPSISAVCKSSLWAVLVCRLVSFLSEYWHYSLCYLFIFTWGHKSCSLGDIEQYCWPGHWHIAATVKALCSHRRWRCYYLLVDYLLGWLHKLRVLLFLIYLLVQIKKLIQGFCDVTGLWKL